MKPAVGGDRLRRANRRCEHEVVVSHQGVDPLPGHPFGLLRSVLDRPQEGAKIVVFPVNYQLIGHAIVFLVGGGSQRDAAMHHKDATFEVDESDSNFQTGWSVMVFGKLRIYEELTDQDDMSRFTHRPWAEGVKQHALVIEPHAVTGRLISHSNPPDIPW
jgi:hypothetical protein